MIVSFGAASLPVGYDGDPEDLPAGLHVLHGEGDDGRSTVEFAVQNWAGTRGYFFTFLNQNLKTFR